MPGLVLNTQQAMKQREAWLPGEYHVTLSDVKHQKATSADKFDMLVLEFTAHQDEGAEYAGRNAFRNLSASPKAIPFMVDAAIALGADPEEVVQPTVDMLAVFKDLVGAECWIQTDIRKWKRDAESEEVEQTDVRKILGAPTA